MAGDNKRLVRIILVVTFLWLLPLIAMQFSKEVNWTLFDFVVAGVLLSAAGAGLEFILRRVHNKRYKLLFVGIILVTFLMIWLELAVGIFGTILSGT